MRLDCKRPDAKGAARLREREKRAFAPFLLVGVPPAGKIAFHFVFERQPDNLYAKLIFVVLEGVQRVFKAYPGLLAQISSKKFFFYGSRASGLVFAFLENVKF